MKGGKQTVFCPNCGKEIPQGGAFCPGCGAGIQSSHQSIGENMPPVPPPLPPQPVYQVEYTPPPPPVTGIPSPSIDYAGFWKRVGAALIDGVILSLGTTVLGWFLGHGGLQSVVVIVLQWLYFATMESSPSRATVGKQVLGIVVTDLYGGRLSFGKASARYLGKILSTITLGIGYIMVAFTAKKQGLHDMLAGTLVVNNK